ncbi:D-alanyl-D-alanine carboxypeptidase family protein [Butyrivibrio sp. FCS014]|uniref:D-alanyl-D-alanine carboxypeptidase family protein n=1 Tax=Butyrivibrio sp. FCS014 TaxID=1408304 RepID=UPI0004641D50|nr:serine hydrolase [Butyrivibrio sp. FCS014]
MGNSRANYRRKDGKRLTASEYRSRRKKEIIIHLSSLATVLLAVTVGTVFIIHGISKSRNSKLDEASTEVTIEEVPQQIEIVDTIVNDVDLSQISKYQDRSDESASFFDGYIVEQDSNTAYISSDNVKSNYGLLINLDTGKVVASKDGNVRINPASMTKILTLLVAVEHLDDIDNTFTMTREIGDYVFSNDCSQVGFEVGETVTIRDLLYGTILPSGADAALCLAEYVAGSQEAFVELMNEKLEELGLSDTAHFTNCVGVYDKDHYCTLMDMAMILKAAEENKLCHEVLNARTYLTTSTAQHPEGIQISNWFLRRIEDKDTHGEVVGAKTGFVNQSGCCGASYQVSNDGSHYICVTADAWSSWRCIYDHVDIYETYTS